MTQKIKAKKYKLYVCYFFFFLSDKSLDIYNKIINGSEFLKEEIYRQVE